MEYNRSHIAFLPIAIILLAYGVFFTDEMHHFVLNAGWENNVISSRLVIYVVVCLGVFFTFFYALLRRLVYSRTLVRVHIIFYLLLALTMVFWERNTFSLHDSYHEYGNRTLRDIKENYNDIADRNDYYRSAFWLFLIGQTVCFFNLLLGFFKSRNFDNSEDAD